MRTVLISLVLAACWSAAAELSYVSAEPATSSIGKADLLKGRGDDEPCVPTVPEEIQTHQVRVVSGASFTSRPVAIVVRAARLGPLPGSPGTTSTAESLAVPALLLLHTGPIAPRAPPIRPN